MPSIFHKPLDDTWDLNTGWQEITVAAFGPGELRQAKNGRILFASGSKIMSTTLEGVTESTWTANLTESPRNPYLILDNQIVKLKHGELIYSHMGVTWKDNVNPHPSWWNSFVRWPCKKKIDGTPGETLPGARAVIYFWRSTDAGKTWSRLPDIDAAKLRVPNPYPSRRAIRGLVARPRHAVKDGKKACSVGGFDGHHLYADPYTGNLFLTTQAKYGDRDYVEKALSLVLVSEDKGDSWKVCFRIDDIAFFRAPVTSLPTGEVGFVYNDGKAVKLAILKPPYKYGRAETRTVTIVTTSGKPNPGAEFNQNNPNKPGEFATWGTNTIARHRSGGYLVARHLWADGAAPASTLMHQMFKVDLPKILPVRPIGDPIKAEDTNGDTIHGALVEGDPSENLAMFYWVDRDGSHDSDKYTVKYRLYDATGIVLTEPGTLTLDNGNEYAWEFASSGAASSHFVGDYMAGASFRRFPDDGERFFVATWSEEGRLRANIVTVGLGSQPRSRRARAPGARRPTKKLVRTALAVAPAENLDQIGD